MTAHNEKTPATAPTVNEGTKSIAERSVATIPFHPPYKRHKVYSSEGGINRCLCGHTRSTEESDQIIAALGDAWYDCPPCEPCHAMAELAREFKRDQARREKALKLANFILQHLEEQDL